MTPGGADFLVANLDPFHDNQLKELAGWPDEETAPSVIRIIKQSLTLKAPASAGTGNWDALITAWPFLDIIQMGDAARTFGNNVINSLSGAPTGQFGGVTMHSKASSALAFNLSTDFASQLALDPVYSQGVGRLIGYGFEVVNTTSDLYRQGLATVWRQSQPLGDSGTYTQLTLPNERAYFEGVTYRQPPLTTADALLYPGSRQWKAEDGCYIVAPFTGGDNQPIVVGYAQPVVTKTDDLSFFPNTSNIWVPLYSTVGVSPNTAAMWKGVKHYPYHMVGAIFDGLSNQTTLQVNVNIIYETFPNVSERDILVLAKPSCSYDPVALKALSEVLSSLPVGVPAHMNAGGDWFYDLVSTISEYAPAIGDLIPGGKLIGQGIGSLADLGLTYMTPPGDTNVPETQASQVRKKKKENSRTLANKVNDTKQQKRGQQQQRAVVNQKKGGAQPQKKRK